MIFLQSVNESMYKAGKFGLEIGAQGSATAKLIFKSVPVNIRKVATLNLHPFVYYRRGLIGRFGAGKGIGYTWEEGDLPMAGISLRRQ